MLLRTKMVADSSAALRGAAAPICIVDDDPSFLNDRVSRVCYGKKSGAQLSVGEVNDLLTINVPEDVEWSAPVKDEASDQYWYLGIKNGDGTPT